jgi:hypothetical protein
MEDESDSDTSSPEAWAELADYATLAISDCSDSEKMKVFPPILDFASLVADSGMMPGLMFYAYQDFDLSVYPNAVLVALGIVEEGN